MALSTQSYKGARDFYPEDKRTQKYMFSVMRRVVERYGYQEYDAPILEPLDLYLAKTGEEIINEQVYSFTDRGERIVAIRPEMTPTVSRMVAGKRQELAYPLRWYSIPNLWRYERPQRGRLREHWQLNVDVFGIENISAEHELIVLANDILKEFGAKPKMYEIRVNSRKLMDLLMKDYLGLDATQIHLLDKIIDRKNKIDEAVFAAQIDSVFIPSQRENGAVERLTELLKINQFDDLPTMPSLTEPIEELKKLMKLLKGSGVENAVFDMTLMRGFDYYTDIVFEVFDTDPENNRSMFGGGRYDGLVGLFGVEPVATVGFGLGDVTLQNFLETHKLLPEQHTETDVYIALLGDVYEAAQPIIAELREDGVNVAVDSSERKIDKQIKTADKNGIRYVLFIGEKELETSQLTLKDIHTGATETHGIERIVSIIKDYRKN